MQRELARILDANFNRAREGLRVAEEFARFVAEDRVLAEQVKDFRHELAQAARQLDGGGELLAARDTAADVGATIKTESESVRADAADVAVAAAKRVGEALRVLAEYAKPVDDAVAARLERLRYRFYDWEKWLAGATDRRRFAGVRLYLILSADLCRGGDWRSAVRQAIDGGVDAIQLREKSLADGELLERADWLVRTCRAARVLSVVNDRADVARLVNADGLHVGQEDLPVESARRILKPNQFVGLSTHTPEQLSRALGTALFSPVNQPVPPASRPVLRPGEVTESPTPPDYVALGPMFPTATKPQERVAGPAYAKLAVAKLDALGIAHVAIGGITLENLDQVLAAGVRRVAVCSAILGADDLVRVARSFQDRMGR